MLTKDKERKALKRIEAVLEELRVECLNDSGELNVEQSYILTAFRGVLEDARDNIENDFANSQQERADLWEKKAEDNRRAMLDAQEAQALAEARTISPEEAQAIRALAVREYGAAQTAKQNADKNVLETCGDPGCEAFRNAVSEKQNAERRLAQAKQVLDAMERISR